MKDTVCLVDIPMPNADESQNDKNTSKEAATISNPNTTEQTSDNTKSNSSEKPQSDLHRQFNLISVPPPPPPNEPKSTSVSNIVISNTVIIRLPFYFCLNIHLSYLFLHSRRW